jgi:hypothetical protein
MSNKKQDKKLAAAEEQFQQDQVRAAQIAEQIDIAYTTIMEFKSELTEQALADALKHVEERREDVKRFLLDSRDKYVAKLKA